MARDGGGQAGKVKSMEMTKGNEENRVNACTRRRGHGNMRQDNGQTNDRVGEEGVKTWVTRCFMWVVTGLKERSNRRASGVACEVRVLPRTLSTNIVSFSSTFECTRWQESYQV